MLSILIATKNRSSKLNECLESIENNNFSDYEILVLDQSDDLETKKIIKKFARVRYFSIKSGGKSKALNKGISAAKGEVLCFTDDDCIAEKNWLYKTHDFFNKKINEETVGFMGKTVPYKNEKKSWCPATYDLGSERKIFKFHDDNRYDEFGLGSNMAFKKDILVELGGFKEWLGYGSLSEINGLMKLVGVGSWVGSGEERELFYRILKNGYSLNYEPDIMVLHNKLVSYREFTLAQTIHTRGLMTFFSYYLFSDFLFMSRYIAQRIEDAILDKIKKNSLRFARSGFGAVIKIEVFCIFIEIFSVLQGFVLGNYFKFFKRQAK